MNELELLIFDLDDTLIITDPLYRMSVEKFAHEMKKHGFEYDEAKREAGIIGKELKAKVGFAKNVHPTSFVLAYEQLCRKYDRPVNMHISCQVELIGESVYSGFAHPYAFTYQVLSEIRERGFKMAILTRGDKTVQLKRVLDAHLANYFDDVFVVVKKTPKKFEQVCQYYDVSPNQSVMIGNHMIGDVLPALEAGLFGIFIPNGTSNIEKVLQPPPPEGRFAGKLYKGKDLRDVPKLLERIELDG